MPAIICAVEVTGLENVAGAPAVNKTSLTHIPETTILPRGGMCKNCQAPTRLPKRKVLFVVNLALWSLSHTSDTTDYTFIFFTVKTRRSLCGNTTKKIVSMNNIYMTREVCWNYKHLYGVKIYRYTEGEDKNKNIYYYTL